MAKKLKGDQVFTGQSLVDGDVVFMAEDGNWSRDLQMAVVATDAQQVEVLEQRAQRAVEENMVIDVYPMVVVKDSQGNLQPDHIREKIRVSGPSIDYN